MNQIKTLSEYTAEVLKKEAYYNSSLKSDQLAADSRLSFWFGMGAFIPDEIKEFKPLWFENSIMTLFSDKEMIKVWLN